MALVAEAEADPCLLQRDGSRECGTSLYYFSSQPRLGASSGAGINNGA